MGNSDTSIRAWKAKYRAGDFSAADRNTMIGAGWYDWFCTDDALKRRLDRMANIVMALTDGGRVNLDTMYVWFKNNCGEDLYDDLRISARDDGRNEFVISFPEMPGEHVRRGEPDSPWVQVPTRIEVFVPANHYSRPVFAGSAEQVIRWLNTAA